MFRKKHIKIWLLVAFALETASATYGLKITNWTALTSIIYFIAGIGVAVLIVCSHEASIQRNQSPRFSFFSSLKLLLFFVMLIVAFLIARYWFDRIPIDPDYADMLPIIKVMNERFVAGQWRHVYDTIPEIWNGTKPVYMPAMWLPYSPAVMLNIDIRWITVICLLLIFSVFLYLLNFDRYKALPLFNLLIAVALFWWIFADDDSHGFITLSEEGVVAFYYVVLIFAITTGDVIFIAIAASLCMLSRYAVIGWLPAFLYYLIRIKRKRAAIAFIFTGFCCLMVMFIIPFGWRPFMQLTQLPNNYIEFARTVWKDSRESFWLSLGFAKFFGPAKTAILHTTLIIVSFVIPVVFVSVCLRLKKRINLNNIPLGALKIAVIFFYNFIDVPYLYLFYTSSFISLISVVILTQPKKHF